MTPTSSATSPGIRRVPQDHHGESAGYHNDSDPTGTGEDSVDSDDADPDSGSDGYVPPLNLGQPWNS